MWLFIWLIHFVVSFFFWNLCYQVFTPAYVPKGSQDTHHIGEQHLKTVNFCHASMCTIFVCGYYLNLFSPETFLLGKIYSTSFFIWEMFQVLHIYNRLYYLGLHQQNMKDPRGTLFHHVVTIFFIHNFMFNKHANVLQSTGLVIFYLAEIAMLPVLATWAYLHTNQEASFACAVCRIVEVVLYGAIRVVLVPILFFACMLPAFQVNTLVGWLILLCYGAVYALNVGWFLDMSGRSVKELYHEPNGLKKAINKLTWNKCCVH